MIGSRKTNLTVDDLIRSAEKKIDAIAEGRWDPSIQTETNLHRDLAALRAVKVVR